MKPVVSEKTDELREQIDAARQRIAAQVAKNAEETSATVAAEIPVAAEKAESVIDQAAGAVQDTAAQVADVAQDAARDAQ